MGPLRSVGIDALTFLFTVAMLLAMPVPNGAADVPTENVLEQIGSGHRCACRDSALLVMVASVALAPVSGMTPAR